MPSDLRDELKEFERDLARVVAKFMKLYDRVEKEVRPGAPPTLPQAPPKVVVGPPDARALPGYQ